MPEKHDLIAAILAGKGKHQGNRRILQWRTFTADK